jgi:aspartyl-tRNA(Asn)/glutamyl-tRNA(Gln) amidotransferase subunit C
MLIDETMTRKVAELARLEVSDSEVGTFTAQLGQILGYVDQLQEISVEGVEPLIHPVELEAPLREDQVVPSRLDSDGNPAVLKSAPDVLYGGYKVPSIL